MHGISLNLHKCYFSIKYISLKVQDYFENTKLLTTFWLLFRRRQYSAYFLQKSGTVSGMPHKCGYFLQKGVALTLIKKNKSFIVIRQQFIFIYCATCVIIFTVLAKDCSSNKISQDISGENI